MFFSECFEMFCLFGRVVRWMGFAVVFRRKDFLFVFCLFCSVGWLVGHVQGLVVGWLGDW